MNSRFQWNESFVTGNKELDKEHKQLFKQLNKLYKMFSDTKKYYDQIIELTEHLESIIVEHFEIENKLLKKYNISTKDEHIQEHNKIKEAIQEIKNYNLPVTITALLLCDVIINYFLGHFQKYDKVFISELNEKRAFELTKS